MIIPGPTSSEKKYMQKYIHRWLFIDINGSDRSWSKQKQYRYTDDNSWRHKQLFVQLVVWFNIKQNIKILCHGPLWGESNGDWWVPPPTPPPNKRDSNAYSVSLPCCHYVDSTSLQNIDGCLFWFVHADTKSFDWQIRVKTTGFTAVNWMREIGSHRCTGAYQIAELGKCAA